MASEVDKIIETMEEGNHFLLCGGAGSGKTHTLIELIQRINEENPKAKIACITYTNVAADEISERANSFSLKASTIHDFLWDNIKAFQANLRKGIIELNTNIAEEDLLDDVEIQYREYVSLKKGVISHSDVIKLTKYIFEKHPLLSKIISDKFDYIFVDEYQDTSQEVIDILFKHLNSKFFDLRIGLFGDSMQSIYDGVGEIETDTITNEDSKRNLIEITKVLNRRNPQSIIDLANKLRNDELKQKPSIYKRAPNVNEDGTIKKGELTFLYSSSTLKNIDDVKKSKYCSNWDYKNYDDKGKPFSKILLIKNGLIAEKAGFNSLFEVYTKDKIVGAGYIKRIKDFLKESKKDYDIESITFLKLLDKLTKEFNKELNFNKAIDLIKDEELNYCTIQKAINSVKKLYPGIEKILPTGSMYTYIIANKDLFNIALSMQFSDLLNIHLNKDKLVGKKKSKNSDSNIRNDEKDILIKYLFKIQEIITFYENRNINELLKKVDYKIELGKHKSTLKDKMEMLCSMTNLKIKDVINFADSSGLLKIDSKVSEFMSSKAYLIERINNVNFSEITNLYNYIEGLTPYSTQHGVKGDEFDNVLVVVNKDKTPQISVCYESLFENKIVEDKYFNRTLNLFYVACTRAKESLVVFYEGECSTKVLSKAKEWFGDENVIDLDNGLI
ncbi:UvrD-helicase domain-containing protein [Wenyingzhuangia marina]|uniref:DNA helicase-2 / ATP-dependent DNA helicase PcrA n=1 Tax=Wenyingzhuangia marina TaxID=1195760 RepID=A0A1M5V4C5_9FLAO|nr:UvrD-helicase domain-containing protein [Wenyingzhuangia marina]GGF74636.1 DNA helicase [Wenyingzhuangia marina]SHH69813.1 DNA helicase-2 / ATP-dependent DNA helicase PcrA [Wenyingzhuangia marina]